MTTTTERVVDEPRTYGNWRKPTPRAFPGSV